MAPFEYQSMGILTAQHDVMRQGGDDPMDVPNMLVQTSDTYGTFSLAGGNFLEVVAGPAI